MLKVVSTPFEPKTKLGKIVKKMNECMNVFTNYWFSKDARKTNNKLIELSSDFFIIYTFILDLDVNPEKTKSEQNCGSRIIKFYNFVENTTKSY